MTENMKGIAFSGGGIRSAAYSHGVIKELILSKKMNNFNYASTVSGGGYIYLQMYNAASAAPPDLDDDSFINFNSKRHESYHLIFINLLHEILFYLSLIGIAIFVISIHSNFISNPYFSTKITYFITLTLLISSAIYYFSSTDKKTKATNYVKYSFSLLYIALISYLAKKPPPHSITFTALSLVLLSLSILTISYLQNISSTRNNKHFQLLNHLKLSKLFNFFILATPLALIATFITQLILRNYSQAWLVSTYIFVWVYTMFYLYTNANNINLFRKYKDSLYLLYNKPPVSYEKEALIDAAHDFLPKPLISLTTLHNGVHCLITVDHESFVISEPKRSLESNLKQYSGNPSHLNVEGKKILNLMTLSAAAIDNIKITGNTLIKDLARAVIPSLGLYVRNPCYKNIELIHNLSWKQPKNVFKFGEIIFKQERKIDESALLKIADGGFFDNTGIAALLIKKVTEIYCFDASHDPDENKVELKKLIEQHTSLFNITDLVKIALSNNCTKITGKYADNTSFKIFHFPHWGFHNSLEKQRDCFPHHPTSSQDFDFDLYKRYMQLGQAAANLLINDKNAP